MKEMFLWILGLSTIFIIFILIVLTILGKVDSPPPEKIICIHHDVYKELCVHSTKG